MSSKTEYKEYQEHQEYEVHEVKEAEFAIPTPPLNQLPLNPLIIETIKLLIGFHQQPEIIPIIFEIVSTKGSPQREEIIDSVRVKLHALVSDAKKNAIKIGNRTLCDAAYQALLALARYYPKNDENIITGTYFKERNLVVISTGYQFDIKDLIRFHNKRKCITKLGETPDSKILLNYYIGSPGLPFSPRDTAHLLRFSAERNVADERAGRKSVVAKNVKEAPDISSPPMSPEEEAEAGDMTSALVALRHINELTPTRVKELLEAKKVHEICGLIVAFYEVEEFSQKVLIALLKEPEYVTGLRWGLAVLRDTPLFTPPNRKLFMQQDPGDVYLLAYALDALQETNELNEDSFAKLLRYAKSLVYGIRQLQIVGNLLISANFISFFAHAHHAKGLGKCLKSLREAGMLRLQTFLALLEKAQYADGLGRCLGSLQKVNSINVKTLNALLKHAPVADSVGQVLEGLQREGISNSPNVDASVLEKISDIHGLSKVLEGLYETQSASQRNFSNLLKYASNFSAELIFLEAAGITLTPKSCVDLLKLMPCLAGWRGVSRCLHQADLLTPQRVVALLELGRDIEELDIAFAYLDDFDILLPGNIVVLLQYSRYAVNLAKGLKILYEAKLLPAMPENRVKLSAQAQYLDDLLPILVYLQDADLLDQDHLGTLLAQAQYEVLAPVLRYLWEKKQLNRKSVATVLAQAPYVHHLVAGQNTLQEAGILDPENYMVLLEHIPQADDLAQALVSLHQAGILDSISRAALVEHIQHISDLSQGLISLQLAGALDRQSFTTLLQHPQQAAALGQALACLKRAGLAPANQDALLAQMQHIDGLSKGLTYLQRRGKLNQTTFNALLEQPQRAASLGQELADMKSAKQQTINDVEVCFWQHVQKHLSEKESFDKMVKKEWFSLTGEQLIKTQAFAKPAEAKPGSRLLKPHDFNKLERWLRKVPSQGAPFSLGIKLLIYCVFKTQLRVAVIDSGSTEDREEILLHAKWGPRLVPLMAKALTKVSEQNSLQALASFAAQRVAELTTSATIASATAVTFFSSASQVAEKKESTAAPSSQVVPQSKTASSINPIPQGTKL
jgi:hypothetical protein